MSREIAPSRLKMTAAVIGERFAVPARAILSRDRSRQVHAARSAVMRELWAQGFSQSAIGRAMDRDHTTVGYIVRKAHP